MDERLLKGFEPIIVETPWGQKVQHDPVTYMVYCQKNQPTFTIHCFQAAWR